FNAMRDYEIVKWRPAQREAINLATNAGLCGQADLWLALPATETDIRKAKIPSRTANPRRPYVHPRCGLRKCRKPGSVWPFGLTAHPSGNMIDSGSESAALGGAHEFIFAGP